MIVILISINEFCVDLLENIKSTFEENEDIKVLDFIVSIIEGMSSDL